MSAYIIFNYQINNHEAYSPYLAEAHDTLEAHGGEVLAADFDSEGIEGDAKEVTILLRFPSKEAAKKWYQSPEYQNIIGLHLNNTDGICVLAK